MKIFSILIAAALSSCVTTAPPKNDLKGFPSEAGWREFNAIIHSTYVPSNATISK